MVSDKIIPLPFDYNLYLRGDVLDIIIGILSVVIAYKAITISLRTARVQNELQGYQMIAEDKRTYLTLFVQQQNSIQNESEFTNNNSEETTSPIDVAFEDLCNSYDIFCGKYLSGEINKKRFLRDYSGEIINWVNEYEDVYKKNNNFPNTIPAYNEIKKRILAETKRKYFLCVIKDFLSLIIIADHVEDLDKRYKKALQKLSQK